MTCHPQFRRVFFTLISILLLSVFPASAQILPETGSEEETDAPEEIIYDPLERQTPRGTVRGFLSAVANQNYTEAMQYLNLTDSLAAESTGEQIAIILQQLLDQGSLLPTARIANDPDGVLDDGLSQNMERVGTIMADGESIDVLLEQSASPEGNTI